MVHAYIGTAFWGTATCTVSAPWILGGKGDGVVVAVCGMRQRPYTPPSRRSVANAWPWKKAGGAGLVLLALVALASIAFGADRDGAVRAGLDAGAVVEMHAVGAARAGRAAGAVAADQAVVPTDATGALAGITGLVDPAGAGKREAALPAVGAWGVFNEAAESVAVFTVAAILVEEHAAVALEAVLTVLAGAVLADLAVGNGGVSLGRALAAVIDGGDDQEPAGLAGERFGAPTLELTNSGSRKVRRARRDALAVEQVGTIAADAAGVATHRPHTEMARALEASAAFAGHGTGLDPAALA